MSSEASAPVGFVAHLPEHWEKNSLYGAYAAIGRFNLCRAYDIAKLIERPLRTLQPYRPPSTTHLFEFMNWVAQLKVASDEITHPLLRRVIAKARQDLTEVPLEWYRASVSWCPQCMKRNHHKAIHQHRSLWFCPEHHVRLEQFCNYCGQHNGYRVFFDREPLRCGGCGCRLDGVDDGTTSQPAAPKASPVEDQPTCQLAERVWIAGLPRSSGPSSALGISPHDVRIYAAEEMRAAELSPQSRVLSQYFRLIPHWQIATTHVRTHEEAISRVAAQAHTLAQKSGHACMQGMAGGSGKHQLACPCSIGFSLWLLRTRRGQNNSAPWSDDINLLAYESSHLGLCLSVSWLAHVQAQLMGKTSAHEMMLAFWDLPSETQSPGPRSEHISETRAFVSHIFQWSAVHCCHVSNQVMSLRERLSTAGRRSSHYVQSDVIADASWIMDQIGVAARR
ncbi:MULTISPECIES: hypothetical protein [Xanthomonas]|uniref:hypothetical protein n=1 Tax=Xanthomonas TaxID=338 RepID=UPI00136DB996|nr:MULTISPECIES: hypothetical protein [Xanthomonas]MBB4770763.1 hypothetical protein [Xanthomonas arboricola]MCC5091279.1 hypothetical protein [Xanthomonas campestris]MCW1981199.1 hypothetical protein [Xanthomonas campestris]MCW2006534.1 hypothetical protein [Xanthomonas campestris]